MSTANSFTGANCGCACQRTSEVMGPKWGGTFGGVATPSVRLLDGISTGNHLPKARFGESFQHFSVERNGH